MVHIINRLALGTVQFGLPYGIANINGQVSHDTATAILRRARADGLDTLDTAIAYGESEQCLGDIGVDDWTIISKLPEFPNTCTDVTAWVQEQVQASLTRLGVSRLKGLLLHKPSQLLTLEGRALWSELKNLKKCGVIEKIGFSIYEPGELDSLWPAFYPDLVQTPYNVLDRRLSKSGWLQRMNEVGVEVHVRSVFLQGLLLMSEDNRPKKFDRWSTLWAAWHTWLDEQGFTALQACISFVMSDPRISKVIVGVETLEQLEEILLSTRIDIAGYPQTLETEDMDLINPSRWTFL